MGPVFVYPDGCRRLHNQSSDWCSEGVLSESVSTVSQAGNCLSLRFLFYFFCAVVFKCQLSLLASTVSDRRGGGGGATSCLNVQHGGANVLKSLSIFHI